MGTCFVYNFWKNCSVLNLIAGLTDFLANSQGYTCKKVCYYILSAIDLKADHE